MPGRSVLTDEGHSEDVMFKNQRGNSGVGGLLGVAGLLAAWMAVAAVMWDSYVAPQVRESEQCQMVCRQTNTHAKG